MGLLVGIAAAVVLALLLGAPTLRLRADYLAIVTIAAAEILRLTFRSVSLDPIFGGSDGINRFADPSRDRSAAPTRLATGERVWMSGVQWAPDSKRLAWSDNLNRIRAVG